MNWNVDYEPEPPTLYRIGYSFAGRAWFAEREIKQGTRILAEDVLLSIANTNVDDGLEERIISAYKQLTTTDQESFDSLHSPLQPGRNPLVSRYMANCFELKTSPPGEAQPSAIFLKASRINHSCCPNACFAWNPNLCQLTVHAMQDIPLGKEITIAYDIPFQSYATRQETFQKVYRFTCGCRACRIDTESGRRSEERRQRMEILWWDIEKEKESPSADKDLEYKLIQTFIELAKLEELDGGFLSSMYGRASMHAKAKGLWKDALAYGILENRADRRLLGVDHPNTNDSTMAVRELQHKEQMEELRVSGQDDGGGAES